MTVTRAFQLEETGLFETGKNRCAEISERNRRTNVIPAGEDAYTPVAETVFISKKELEEGTDISERFLFSNSTYPYRKRRGRKVVFRAMQE